MTEPKTLANPDSSTRGHNEQTLAKRIYCPACGKTKPKRGGWSEQCTPVPIEKRRMWG